MTPLLDIHDVTVAYHRRPVLWDVDLTFEAAAVGGDRRAQRGGQEHADQGGAGPGAAWPAAACKCSGSRWPDVRQRIGYVPQRESVDWDFPVSVLDVVLMGTYGRLGWIRRPGRAERDWARQCLDKVGLAQLRAAADRPAFRRPAAARVPGPGAGPAGRHLFHGRADRRRRCGDRADDLRVLRGLRERGQDDHRRAPRPADRPAVFRLRRAAQRAAGRGRPARSWSSRRRTCGRPTAAGWRCSTRPARPSKRRAERL